ncbi:MAG: antirestriction protein ArdA [Pseudomonadota bacterium]
MTATSQSDAAEIRIYVACLASYNNAMLHGAWISANQDEANILAAIRAMLANSPIPDAEEYAIHDYEGFGPLRIGEYQGVAEIADIAAFIAQKGDLAAELVFHYGDVGAARDALENRYAGSYEDLEAFAQELTEQTTQIPEPLQYYIDWRAMARDLAISDAETFEIAGEVHVFWHR